MYHPVFVIAEIGVNHNGSAELARALIDAAVEAGADAVKLQTFRAEKMMTSTTPKAVYQMKSTGESESQYEMIKKLELSDEAHLALQAYCLGRKIQLLSSPFDLSSLEFLVNTLHLPLIKIASGEITNGPLLLKAAASGKKVILSTGMSTLGEIEEALGVLAFGYLEGAGASPARTAFKEAYYAKAGQRLLAEKVSLLHCTSEYPAPVDEINLSVLQTLRQCFGLPVGYSDHSLGIGLPLAAVALGATIIEKHVTLDRTLPGPDHRASIEPHQLVQMVQGIREIELAIGQPHKRPTPSELPNRKIARKSVVAACPIQKGDSFTVENLTVKRPGEGISPLYFWELLGKPAPRAYHADEVIT